MRAKAVAAVGTIREYLLPIAAGVMVAAIVVLYALVIPAVGRISMQAKAGGAAHKRQCDTLPVSLKIYADARVRGVISAADLRVFRSTAPKCPTP